MKNFFPALGGALLLTSCAGVHVSDTQIAAVVTDRPSAIYIQPFSIAGAQFTGHHAGGPGEQPLRESLAPAAFSEDLKEELEKIAPARVLHSGEAATQGWLVEGSIDEVDAGNPAKRLLLPPLTGAGRSHIKIHVRILDLDHRGIASDSKSEDIHTRHGHVIYEFDVAGGSHLTGRVGSATAPADGYSAPFDYRNAAERIYAALQSDAHRYGEHISPTIRE